uniref:Uncharacterized protein n=1 Tax=Kwoniella pini CBS 10737 TaxID=1296096 RepID=A0A1B9HZZ7_9TREE|nr:uncharacterized protein I206_05621 [Kwoniella pini CBS 10737]OCF48840.1 hypothetical protein I206_05621 [Kwoniella pini CBS 10737]
MNARKVYETPELFSGILQFVERRQFWRVLALERSSFEAAARELWRNVNYQFAKKVINEHTIEEFEDFCEAFLNNNADQVEVLILDHSLIASRFGLNKIDSVITYISETFPNLYHLELPFSINGPDHNFIPVTQIRVVQSLTTNRLNNLERVVINISSTQFMSGRDVRYPFPLEDVAANLAALGANETCIYELRNNSPTFIGMDMSRRLNKEVHDIQKIQRLAANSFGPRNAFLIRPNRDLGQG